MSRLESLFRHQTRPWRRAPRKVIIALSLAMLAACNAEKVALERTCDRKNDGKRIETEGFLNASRGLLCSDTSGRNECGFRLSAHKTVDEGVYSEIEVGFGPNTMDKPLKGLGEKYLIVRDDSNNVLDLEKSVVVSGRLRSFDDPTSPEGGGCFIQVDRIEQRFKS
ncbi:MAG: hypothetical protein R2684_02085 [Pyrinomonadaceae bacterium]